MLDQNARDGQLVDARVVFREIVVERDQFEIKVPVLVIATWLVFLEGRLELVREAAARRHDEVARRRSDGRINHEDVALEEVRLHGLADDLQGEALVRKLGVDPDEIAVLERSLASVDLLAAVRASLPARTTGSGFVSCAAKGLDVVRLGWGLLGLLLSQGIASTVNQPFQRNRKAVADLHGGFSPNHRSGAVCPSVDGRLSDAGDLRQLSLRKVEVLHHPTDAI